MEAIFWSIINIHFNINELKYLYTMSLLLTDKVWVMLSEVAKRGVYPTHSSKLGIYRLPVDINGQTEINSVMNDLKGAGYNIDTFADRIFVTYNWVEKGFDIYTNKEQTVTLYVTVEIVTGEVIDLIYQIRPLECFGDCYWVKDYRKKADHYAKVIIDTVLRNTRIGQKLVSYYQKTQKLSLDDSVKKLEEITPLVNKPKEFSSLAQEPPTTKTELPTEKQDGQMETVPSTTEKIEIPQVPLSADTTISLTGSGTSHSAIEGPIDTDFKSKRKPAGKFKGIEVWGPYDAPGQLGIWGTNVCVDFDICISDGACIDACPVNVYEWLETPGHPASERKPFMAREKDCIFCLACENVCPPQAIKIYKK